MQNSLTESDIIPVWAQTAGMTRCFFYTGTSMNPTFRPGYLLFVRPQFSDLQLGDVIVFSNNSGQEYTVHRIIGQTERGLVTRGDNNSRPDGDLVLPTQIVGRVEHVAARKRAWRVRNGHSGLRAAILGWIIRANVLRIWMLVFRTPYLNLRDYKPLRRLLVRLFAKRIMRVRLQVGETLVIKTTFDGRTIAHWYPASGTYRCRKPYDLFIDPPEFPRSRPSEAANVEVQ